MNEVETRRPGRTGEHKRGGNPRGYSGCESQEAQGGTSVAAWHLSEAHEFPGKPSRQPVSSPARVS